MGDEFRTVVPSGKSRSGRDALSRHLASQRSRSRGSTKSWAPMTVLDKTKTKSWAPMSRSKRSQSAAVTKSWAPMSAKTKSWAPASRSRASSFIDLEMQGEPPEPKGSCCPCWLIILLIILLVAGMALWLIDWEDIFESSDVVVSWDFSSNIVEGKYQLNGKHVTKEEFIKNATGVGNSSGISYEDRLKAFHSEIDATQFVTNSQRKKVKAMFAKCFCGAENKINEQNTDPGAKFLFGWKFHYNWSDLPKEISGHKTEPALMRKIRRCPNDKGEGKISAIGAIRRLELMLTDSSGQELFSYKKSVPLL